MPLVVEDDNLSIPSLSLFHIIDSTLIYIESCPFAKTSCGYGAIKMTICRDDYVNVPEVLMQLWA